MIDINIDLIDKNFDTKHLSEEQQKIANVILSNAFINGLEDWSANGCKTFYTPSEWKERGELVDFDDLRLIVVYDGSDLRYMITMDGCEEMASLAEQAGFRYKYAYNSINRVTQALNNIGYLMIECTNWYSAVYRK